MHKYSTREHKYYVKNPTGEKPLTYDGKNFITNKKDYKMKKISLFSLFELLILTP